MRAGRAEAAVSGEGAPAALATEGGVRPDDSRAVVAAIVARSGSSFYWAMWLLPPARRAAMFAIYAFCRAVDDVVDAPGAAAAKRAALAEWRGEVDRVYAGAPETPIGQELRAAVLRFDLPRDDLLTVIDGMEMDAGAPIVAPSLAELDLYCARVAGAVGHLSIRAFGAPIAAGRRVADSLGRAFQLTNILRDLAEDAAIGRLYLPEELLHCHGIAVREPAAVLSHPGLPLVCEDLAAQAERHFAAAAAAMRDCPRASMRPARVMTANYHRLLQRLRTRGWTRLDEPVSLPKPAKILIALRYGLF